MKNIFLFYGEEDFLIDEKVGALKSRIDNPALNVEALDGENLSLPSLSAALQTAPMFGGEKLVIVNGLEVTPENQEGLMALLKNIPAGLQVVFRAASIDKRSKFYKLINAQGEAVEFKTFAPWEEAELGAWIENRVRGGGKKIGPAAAQLLQEICGSNLRLLTAEIEKLITFVGERGEIREEDVAVLASPGEISAFALLDALREKDLKQALSLFQVLLKNKEDLFQLLGLLATQYRLMLQIKSLPNREEGARALKGSPYFIKKCAANIGRFTADELKDDLEYLLKANLQLKTGEQQAIIFELLLASLCRN